MNAPIRAVCRVWLDEPQTAILLFPDDPEPGDCINSWEPRDGHAAASRDLSQRTRPATLEETLRVKRLYERTFDCTLTLLRRMPPRRARL